MSSVNNSYRSRSKISRAAAVRAARQSPGTAVPPQLTIPVVVGKVFRFQSTSASTGSAIKVSDISDLLCMAATTTSAYALASAIRVTKVEMWGPMASTLVPVTISCDFSGQSAGSVGPSSLKSDTSVGFRAAHLVAKPPKDSQASLWQPNNSAATLFTMVYPSGTIVDLHYSFVIQETASVQAVTAAVAGATVGQVYLRKLDSSGTAILPPVSYVTI